MGDESMEHIRFHLRFNIFSQRPADPNVFKKNPELSRSGLPIYFELLNANFRIRVKNCLKLSKHRQKN